MHLVFGSGLIGSFIAAAGAHAGLTVQVIGRHAALQRLAAGVTLTDYLGHELQAPSVAEYAHDQAPDVVWLTVKCTGLNRAVDQLRQLVGPQTMIVCCQNGLRAVHQIRSAFPRLRVFAAVVPFNVVLTEQGTLHRGSEGSLTLPKELGRIVPSLVPGLHSELLPVRLTSQIHAVQAAKLQLNLSNAVNALSNLPVKTMLSHRGYRRIIAELMREWLDVARVNKIPLVKVARVDGKWLPFMLNLPDGVFKRVASKMLDIDPSVRTSMWWDLQQGKLTEVDDLNGEVVRQGVLARNYCPANKVIIDLVHQAEQQRRQTGTCPAMSASQIWHEIEIKRLEKSSYKF